MANALQHAEFERVAQELNPALLPSRCEGGLGFGKPQDRLLLQELYHTLQTRHPAAGAPYWSTRLWQLATWQACYLAVAAEKVSCSLVFASLKQRKLSCSVYGYHAALALPAEQTTNTTNARQLGRYVQAIFSLIREFTPLNKPNSFRLISDMVNQGLLAYAQRHKQPLSQLHQEASVWNEALSIPRPQKEATNNPFLDAKGG